MLCQSNLISYCSPATSVKSFLTISTYPYTFLLLYPTQIAWLILSVISFSIVFPIQNLCFSSPLSLTGTNPSPLAIQIWPQTSFVTHFPMFPCVCTCTHTHTYSSHCPRNPMHMLLPGFPGGSGKESACLARDHLQCRWCRLDLWVRKVPWRRKWQLTAIFSPGESHGQRCLEGYSPWGRKSRTRLSD